MSEEFVNHTRKSSGLGMAVPLILIALLFIVGPIAASTLGIAIKGFALVMIVGFGLFMLLMGMIIVIITRLYRKTAADEAFVRNGMGGQKAVIGGGAIVIPVVHEVIQVSLQTMKLIVVRSGENALITGDNLRADVTAEFFIKVQKKEEDVIAAATSLGSKASNPKAVEDTVSEKLINALRTVGATKQLAELHTKRDDFASSVQKIVELDLTHNGLTLESVTISKLDQTPIRVLHAEDNVFDAQGAKRIAEITQQARVERNKIEREADKVVEAQNVEKDQFIYEQTVKKSTAEAERDRQIKLAQAQAEQSAATFAAEQLRLSEVARVETDKAVQVAQVQMAQHIEVANQIREQAARQAEIEKERAVEIALREKGIAVAEKEKDRALAEAEQYTAEADAEKARQEVKTVETIAAAERERNRAVLEEQAGIQKEKLRQEMQADVAAYTRIKHAEAEQQAAAKQADARLKLAEAEKQAALLKAEGDQAQQLVPVEVERQQVAVERQNLENQATFEQIARALKVELARIEADKDVRMEQAKAVGAALTVARITAWGTTADVTRMMQSFMDGQMTGQYLEGLSEATPQPVKSFTTETVSGLTGLLGGLAKRLTDSGGIDEAALEQLVKRVLSNAGTKNAPAAKE